ncbi:Mlo127p TDEL_0B05360 [Torulaspora delbrueckii]|uniref:Cleavage/polyadenylation specificity factor A subunit N-terminal domain-containing protein n=1 Tax=Torulaspora delbrueckii TaxID=4950 RepID=G8ZPX1_TORDE|nr:hypothetical protein TDEL_0B05360 [Torulaspora delbrueckii]CCE90665.1 hypothetical protein TDEL_0B05360 [Torulaspora delbrueckii]
MRNRHMLEEANETHWIVDVLLVDKHDLLIVEQTRMRRGGYVLRTKTNLEDIPVVNYSESVNVAASLYYDSLSSKEYIILLKKSGTLELLDTNLQIIDVLETGIEQGDNPKFITIDERSERLFINLEENALYSASLHRTDSFISFTKNAENPRKIYEAPSSISYFDAEWHFEVKSGKEFVTIAAILQSNQSGTLFEVIRQSQTESRKKKQRWDSFVELTNLNDLHDSNRPHDLGSGATLKSVSNIGFFIFSFRQIYFFGLPSGPDHYIDGSNIGKYVSFKGLSRESLPEDINDLVEMQPNVFFSQSAKGLEFKLFANYPLAVTANLDLVVENPDRYECCWRELTSACTVVTNHIATTHKVNVFPLSHQTCVLWDRWSGLEFIDNKSLSWEYFIGFSEPSALYSANVGFDFPKLVSSCALEGNKGSLQVFSEGYEQLLNDEIIFSSDEEICDIWPTTQSLWWKTKDGKLISDGVAVKTEHDIIHVTSNDELLAKNPSIATVADIWEDMHGNYVYLSDDGRVRWSGSTLSAQIPMGKKHIMEPFILACRRQHDSSLLTCIGLNDRLIILRDDSVITRGWTDVHADISSIFIIPERSAQYIILGTRNGRIKIFDIGTLNITESIRVGSKKIGLCAIPRTPYVFVYSNDDLLVLEIHQGGKCSVTRVKTDARITLMRATCTSEVYVVGRGGLFSRFRMPTELGKPKPIHQRIDTSSKCFSKFTSFTCSNRLIVTSAQSSHYSHAQTRYMNSAHLLLHDVDSQMQLHCYDLSKNYPQATIADIAAVPYEIPPSVGTLPQKLPSYAERLTLSKCFIVSLNYETADDDSLANLLLFSIDENNCSIDFHLSLNTMFSITAVSNYYNNMFLVAGECLQLFDISYLVQENTFRILPKSNPLLLSGYPTKILGGLPNISSSEQLLKFSNGGTDHRILISNLLKGLQEYKVTPDETKVVHSSEIPKKYLIRPTSSSERNFPSIDSTFGSNRMIVDCSWSQIGNIVWFATAFSDCNLEVLCIKEGEEADDERKVSIKVESQITSVVSLWPKRQALDHRREVFVPGSGNRHLFSITTARGSVFILKEATLMHVIRIQEEAENKIEDLN